MKAEEDAIMQLLTAKTTALFDVTAKTKCNNCPSNRCPDCPHFGINEDTLALIPSDSMMLPDGKNSGNPLRLASGSDVEDRALVS